MQWRRVASYNSGMTITPVSARPRSSLVALLIPIVALVASCGGGGETASTQTAVSELQSTTAPATTEPASTEPATTEPATTEPAAEVGFPGNGEWTAYYRLTQNDGWFASPDGAFTFPVEFECDDASCSTGTRTANPTGDAVPTPFTFDGDIFSTQIDRMEACLSPVTGAVSYTHLTLPTNREV